METRTVKVWESKFKCRYINDINELLKLISDRGFVIKDAYRLGEVAKDKLSAIAKDQNLNMIMTDNEHPIMIPDSNYFDICINPEFYKKYEKEIVNALKSNIINSDRSFIYVKKECFDDELFEILLKKNVTLYFIDINLTDGQIKRLKESHIKAYMRMDDVEKIVSSNIAFDKYKFNDLDTKDEFLFFGFSNCSDEELENFKYIKDNSTISFYIGEMNPIEYYRTCGKIFDILNKNNKKVNVILNVDKRVNFDKSNILKDSSSFNLTIMLGLEKYSVSEYLKEKKVLDSLVKNIKESSMSPFEKYMAVYGIVKNYKPYKENKEDKEASRNIKYILDNEYMVCVGFSSLLIELLDRVDIGACEYNTEVLVEDNNKEGHARTIVNINDEKYGINGIYVADPTWDNSNSNDYFHSVMTFDSMQKSHLMFIMEDIDYIFDVHDFDEYNKKINFLIRKEYDKRENIGSDSKEKRLLYAYSSVANVAMRVIKNIDPKGFEKLSTFDPKGFEKLSTLDYKVSDKLEEYEIFFTELGNYVISRLGKEVSEDSIISAVIVGKEALGEISKDEIKKCTADLKENHARKNLILFPYQNSDLNTLRLLEEKEDEHKKIA